MIFRRCPSARVSVQIFASLPITDIHRRLAKVCFYIVKKKCVEGSFSSNTLCMSSRIRASLLTQLSLLIPTREIKLLVIMFRQSCFGSCEASMRIFPDESISPKDSQMVHFHLPTQFCQLFPQYHHHKIVLSLQYRLHDPFTREFFRGTIGECL